jgi:hypothetical protein
MATAAPTVPQPVPVPQAPKPQPQAEPQQESPRLTYRSQRAFEMRSVAFGTDVEEQINKWLYEQIDVRQKQLRNRHTSKVPEWRRLASGKPREENKSWPFENCANLVHPIIGESTDELSSRVMQLIWSISPIIFYKYLAATKDSAKAQHNADKAKILEQFIDFVANDSRELDLYRVENLWFNDSTVIGTAWVCVAPEKRMEMVHIGYGEGEGDDLSKRGNKFAESKLYEGPKVLNIRDEDMLYDPDADTPEDSDLMARRCNLNRRKLQERTFKGWYKKAEVEKIIGKPDRYGPNEVRKRENSRKGEVASEDRILAEWDIYECYFYWYVGKKKFRLIAWYHKETKTLLNCVFNFIPENQIPLVRTRLSLGESGMNGRGFAEIGQYFQDEISTTKNQRIDATTWGMLGLNRLSPQARNIDKNMKVFPGATLPFNNGEFEHYNVGSVDWGQLSMQNEASMVQQARERFGVGAPVMGMGAGTANKKGQFGSMGTMAVLQDGNSRNNHRTSDFRHSHVKLISLLTDMYGAMGLGGKGSLFGLDDKVLDEALSDFLERKVKIPVRAATASANREVTKQNLMLLNPAYDAYVKSMSTAIQATQNSQLPDFYKKWLKETAISKTRLFQQMIREFQIADNPEEFVPNIEFPAEGQQPNGPQAQQQQRPQLDPNRIAQMAQLVRGTQSSQVPGGPSGIPGIGGGPDAAA